MKRFLLTGAAFLVFSAGPALSEPHRGAGAAAVATPRSGGFGGHVAAPRMMRGGFGGAPRMGRAFSARAFNAPTHMAGGFARSPHIATHSFAARQTFASRSFATGRFAHGPALARQGRTANAVHGPRLAQARGASAYARQAAAHVAANHGTAGVAHQGRVAFGAPGFTGGPGRHAQPHYSARYYPRSINAVSRFHWNGAWRGQPGFYSRHWAYGDVLPGGWFASPFWIDNYWLYDLPIPPFGYVWVRVGPDALLVNVYSGRIVEVVYGLFW